MKTLIDIPNHVLRQSQSAAAERGESFSDYVTESLRERLESQESPEPGGWRRVYGKARPEEVAEVDEIIAREFESIEPDSWK